MNDFTFKIEFIFIFRFDALLGEAASVGDTEWCLKINTDPKLHELIQAVLHFTSLLIEYSFSRHLYSSVEVS